LGNQDGSVIVLNSIKIIEPFPDSVRENTQVFDFKIATDDMRTINAMPYIGGSGLDPDAVGF
jgi:diketogulonate reductase-like aldo/keto reductase